MLAAEKKLVVLDTDPGIDDTMALLYLNALPQVELHSVTTVFGNGPVAQTTKNACFLVSRFGIDVPVHAGAGDPLVGKRFVPDLKVHGEDGLGDVGIAENAEYSPAASPASQHICDVVRANPGRVTLLAIGPLTNLANAVTEQPDIAGLVEQVVVMGGAFGTKGRWGNIRPNAEANFFYDPDAAEAVLSAPWPLTTVGLDVTSDCILTTMQIEAMQQTCGPTGKFLRLISLGYESIYREFDGLDGFCIHDVAAAAYVARPDLFTEVSADLSVGLSTSDRGRSTAEQQADSVKSYCSDVKAEEVVRHFLSVMKYYSDRP